MNEKYPIGSFGTWHFTIKKKRAAGEYETPFVIEGCMVVEVDSKYVWLRGTDGVEYCPEKKRITKFEATKKIEVE